MVSSLENGRLTLHSTKWRWLEYNSQGNLGPCSSSIVDKIIISSRWRCFSSSHDLPLLLRLLELVAIFPFIYFISSPNLVYFLFLSSPWSILSSSPEGSTNRTTLMKTIVLKQHSSVPADAATTGLQNPPWWSPEKQSFCHLEELFKSVMAISTRPATFRAPLSFFQKMSSDPQVPG